MTPQLAAGAVLALAGLFATAGAAAGDEERERQPSGAPAEWPKPVMDAQTFTFFQLRKNEYQIDDKDQYYAWDAQGWIGGDYNKLWLKTQGEYLIESDKTEQAELQALYGRTISPYWDALIGVRSEFEPTQAWDAVVGVEGLAPYFFQLSASAFISGEAVQARLEADYELFLTQRLIAEPDLEVNLSSADIADREVKRGLSSLEAGVRLRYEIIRESRPTLASSMSATRRRRKTRTACASSPACASGTERSVNGLFVQPSRKAFPKEA
jgi:copper resistance protein B